MSYRIDARDIIHELTQNKEEFLDKYEIMNILLRRTKESSVEGPVYKQITSFIDAKEDEALARYIFWIRLRENKGFYKFIEDNIISLGFDRIFPYVMLILLIIAVFIAFSYFISI